MMRRNKALLDIELLAQPVERMPPAGFLVFAVGGKAVGELAAVISERFDDLDGAGLAGNRL
jgi:hypothetical protein